MQRLKIDIIKFPQKNYDDFVLRMGKTATEYDLNGVTDEAIKRKLIKLRSEIGTNILESDDLTKYNKIVNDMIKIYSTAKVPKFNGNKRTVTLGSLMSQRMGQSRNPEELEYYWTKHRETTGKKMREMFKEYLQLNNKAAQYYFFYILPL